MGSGSPIATKLEPTPHTRLNRLVETNGTQFGIPDWKLHSNTRFSTLKHFATVIFRFRRPKWVPELRLRRALNPHLTLVKIDLWKQTARNSESRIGSYTLIRDFNP